MRLLVLPRLAAMNNDCVNARRFQRPAPVGRDSPLRTRFCGPTQHRWLRNEGLADRKNQSRATAFLVRSPADAASCAAIADEPPPEPVERLSGFNDALTRGRARPADLLGAHSRNTRQQPLLELSSAVVRTCRTRPSPLTIRVFNSLKMASNRPRGSCSGPYQRPSCADDSRSPTKVIKTRETRRSLEVLRLTNCTRLLTAAVMHAAPLGFLPLFPS